MLGYPIPPIMTLWHSYWTDNASGWVLHSYQSRIQEFRCVISEDVVTQETVDLTND